MMPDLALSYQQCVAQLVERVLWEHDVEGSNPFTLTMHQSFKGRMLRFQRRDKSSILFWCTMLM
jgi:hypothetical protein